MAGQRPPPNNAIKGAAAATALMDQLSLEDSVPATQMMGAAAATSQVKRPVAKKGKK